MTSTSLPWLGLGVSSNSNAADHPHPYRLSGVDYVEYSAPIDFDRALRETSLFAEMFERRSETPLLFHPVQLNLYGPELEPQEKLIALDDHLRRVGSPWVSNDVAWWHSAGALWPGYQYVAPPFTRQGLIDCTAHALHVQSAIGVPLLLENPAVIAKRGDLHVLEFMAELHARTGCLLLLDLDHLLSFALTAGLPKETGLDAFPLEAVAEIHIAGGMIASRGARTFYFDAHVEPVREELFELLASIAPRCPSLRAVTYEADGHTEEVAAANLARIRSHLPEQSLEPIAVAPPRAAEEPLSDEAWSIGRAAYAGPDPYDPPGAEVEREYRLAIAARTLDPISGDQLAPKMAEFARSPELASAFEPPGDSIERAFTRWIRRKLFEPR